MRGAGPVPADPVASAARPCHDPLVASARLIGRDDDLATLRDAVVGARAGVPRCVIVTGEAGIGKSRLVSEALTGVEDALVVTGHGADMATGEIPFGVVADTLRDLLHRAGTDVLTGPEREALAPLLPGLVPSGHVERVQVLSAVVDLLQRLCAERLLVWVVEDLHWVDTATRDLLTLTLRTLRGRLLLVATVRTNDPERPIEQETALTSYVAGLARVPGTTLLPLGRLSAEEVRAQLLGLVGTSLPPGVAARIERLSDGVPFVVEELTAARGRPEVTTVSGVAAGRLTGLSPEARRLVEAAAVGEGHLRLGLLEKVVDSTPDELDSSLGEAVRGGVLTTQHVTDVLGFRHALLREAADREIGPGARRAWHRRWAEVLEDNPAVLAADPAALAIAEHWHHARDARRALAAAVAAVPAAGRIGSPDEETALWTRILHAYDSLDDAAEITGLPVREAYARSLVASIAASHQVAKACVAAVPVHLLSEPERLLHGLVTFDHGKGEANAFPEEQLVTVADAFEDSPPDLLAIDAWTHTGARMTRDLVRGERLVDRARAAARQLGDPRMAVIVEAADSYRAQVNGAPERAAERLREALGRFGDEPWEGVFHLWGNLVWCEVVCGHHREAQRVADEALARLTHPHLSTNAWEHLVENATTSWYLTGQWARARALLETSAPWWEDDLRTSNANLDVLNLVQDGGAARVARWRGQVESPALGGASVTAARAVLALAAITAGDLRAVRTELAPLWAMERLQLYDDQVWHTVVLAARAEADAALAGRIGDRAQAEAHLRTIEEVAAGFRRYGPLGEAWPLDLAAQLDRFHGRDARPILEAALAAWDRIGHVPDTAVTHLSLAEAHVRHGDRSAARRHLTAGRGLATALDARPLLGRADALAEHWGLASRERSATDVLTDREAEVLALLVEGRTNAEIAAALVMSPKTASVHVSHIIAKLGAANRTEAAALARRHGLLR